MICKVRHTIEKYGMIKKGDNILVALSGGADSMCLLDVLLKLKNEMGFYVCAAHINHGIRGAEADRDELFVKEYCNSHSVKLGFKKVDVPLISAQTGEGLEECGRRLRYTVLKEFAGDGFIATAHNLNDRIETFFFNFARGAGLNGLCSIPPVRGNIIRPLIDCSRIEIEQYCSDNSIPFVTDSTNFDTEYSRNRIRHNILPQLKLINDSLEQSADKCFTLLNDDKDYLDLQSNELYQKALCENGFCVDVLNNAHPAIKNRVISLIIKDKTDIIPDFSTVLKISEIIKNEGVVQISSGINVRVRKGVLDFPVFKKTDKWKKECKNGFNYLPGFTVEVLSFNKNDTINSKLNNRNELIYDIDSKKISGNLIFRNRCDGDVYRPVGRNCSKTLKKLFNEKGIPPEKRDEILICNDGSRIVFVEGFGVDEFFSVTGSTESFLRFIIRRN